MRTNTEYCTTFFRRSVRALRLTLRPGFDDKQSNPDWKIAYEIARRAYVRCPRTRWDMNDMVRPGAIYVEGRRAWEDVIPHSVPMIELYERERVVRSIARTMSAISRTAA